MIGSNPEKHQRELLGLFLKDFIDPTHPLALLAQAIDWSFFESEFASLYSKTGQPAMPIRLMVGSLMLKNMYNLGDETLVKEWVMNPYMQYFCGRAYFKHTVPCDPSDFVHFRKRLGTKGVETIFSYSVRIHGKASREKLVLSDTTVQENFTSFPTDANLAKNVIDRCTAIAKAEEVPQRQSYVRVSKQHLRDSYFGAHPKRAGKANKSIKKLRTIAGRLIRELEAKRPEPLLSEYRQELDQLRRVITQQGHDKDKIYSLHKPFTACIAKGKAGKPYEFGNKIGLMSTAKTGIILAIKSFRGNPHDSTTIEPGNSKKADSAYKKRKTRAKFRRRASIEPIIGHLKTDHRMGQNYHHGQESPQMKAYLAACGWNLKKFMGHLSSKRFASF